MKEFYVPRTALRVIAWIRKEIPRPLYLPQRGIHNSLRWGYRCPIGLHAHAPFHAIDDLEAQDLCPKISSYSINSFMDWWDSLPPERAEWAVRRVWGKRKNPLFSRVQPGDDASIE